MTTTFGAADGTAGAHPNLRQQHIGSGVGQQGQCENMFSSRTQPEISGHGEKTPKRLLLRWEHDQQRQQYD